MKAMKNMIGLIITPIRRVISIVILPLPEEVRCVNHILFEKYKIKILQKYLVYFMYCKVFGISVSKFFLFMSII